MSINSNDAFRFVIGFILFPRILWTFAVNHNQRKTLPVFYVPGFQPITKCWNILGHIICPAATHTLFFSSRRQTTDSKNRLHDCCLEQEGKAHHVLGNQTSISHAERRCSLGAFRCCFKFSCLMLFSLVLNGNIWNIQCKIYSHLGNTLNFIFKVQTIHFFFLLIR